MSGARTIGDIALLDLGVQAWSRERRWAGHGDFPLGGIIVGVRDAVDSETGEVMRTFEVIEGHHGKVISHLLTEAEIDRETLQPFGVASARAMVRRLWAEGAKSKGMFTSREADIARWTSTLMGLVV